MTWTDEELVRQFRERVYVDTSPLTPKARAWVAVRAARDADVWGWWATAYLRGMQSASGDAHVASVAANAADLAVAAAIAADTCDDDADEFFDAAYLAAEAVLVLELDDPTLARYIREALAKETDDLD